MNVVATLADRTKQRSLNLAVAGLFGLVLLFFFVSGACGLLYQVVWSRKLVLLFGTTSYAVSTVLSVFFLGLGFGSLWGGRLADRTRRPLALYGLFEIVVGLWALLFILLVGWGESGIAAVLRVFAFSRPVGVILRALLAAGFLFVPVCLMGATLPLLAKFIVSDDRVKGLRIGSLYGINTFGAVTGCALTGFLLVAAFGYTRATFLGAAGNVVVGLLAIGLGRRPQTVAAVEAEHSNNAEGENARPANRPAPRVVLAAFAVSGFCMLALEVLWTRLLGIVFLGTTYAFTTMLTTLLCGIALGSMAAAPLVDRRKAPVFLFGLVEMLIGITVVTAIGVFAWLPEALEHYRFEAGYEWSKMLKWKFVLSFAALFPPTFLSGAAFPIVVRAATCGHNRLGRDVGRLYSANTFGGVLGAVAGGFVIIPLLGTHRGMVLLAAMLFATGVVLILTSPARMRIGKAVAVMLCGAIALGAYSRLPQDVGRLLNQAYLPEDDVSLHYQEGVEATVVVSGVRGDTSGSDRTLWINGVQATTSIEKGVKMNRFQGVLPLLFNRDPREVLFMCFGSGITAGTLGLYNFDRIDAVEIAPDVFDAAHLFKKDNFDVMDNPRVQFIVDDGRNYLLTTENTYDVITFEPMPLALAGVSTFYTREYYTLCLRRLAPGGLVSQWVPLHSLNPEIVRSLVYTFTTVFPEYCAWFLNADLFLVGSNQPIAIDYAGAQQRLIEPAIANALAEVGIEDFDEVLSMFFMSKEAMETYAADGAAMSDDRPWAEFIAPKLVYERNVDQALRELLPYQESPAVLLDLSGVPPDDRQRVLTRIDRRFRARVVTLQGVVEYYGGVIGEGPEEFFKKALAVDPHDYTARFYLKEVMKARTELAIQWNTPEEAETALVDALKYAPDEPFLHKLLADVYTAQDRLDLAQEQRNKAQELAADD